MEATNCSTWHDAYTRYHRHVEECEEYNEMSDVRLVGDCGHKFTFTCQCGKPVEIDGYGITILQSEEHTDNCYDCCGCDLCRQHARRPVVEG